MQVNKQKFIQRCKKCRTYKKLKIGVASFHIIKNIWNQ